MAIEKAFIWIQRIFRDREKEHWKKKKLLWTIGEQKRHISSYVGIQCHRIDWLSVQFIFEKRGWHPLKQCITAASKGYDLYYIFSPIAMFFFYLSTVCYVNIDKIHIWFIGINHIKWESFLILAIVVTNVSLYLSLSRSKDTWQNFHFPLYILYLSLAPFPPSFLNITYFPRYFRRSLVIYSKRRRLSNTFAYFYTRI